MGGCAAALGSMASSAGSAIGSAASSVGSGIASGAQAVGSGIASGVQAVGEFGGGAVDFVSGAAKQGFGEVGDIAGKTVAAPGDLLGQGISKMGLEKVGGFVSDASKLAGTVVDKTISAPGDIISGALGDQNTNTHAFFSQAWGEAKKDIGKEIEAVTVRNEDGSVNGWKTGAKVGYNVAKTALLSSMGSQRKNQSPDDQSQAQQTQPAPNAEQTPSAEDELNKLRNKINA